VVPPPPAADEKEGQGEHGHQSQEDPKEAGENGANSKVKEEPKKPLPPLPPFLNVIDGTKLQDFFYYASGEDPDLYHGKLLEAGAASAAPKSKSKKKKHHSQNQNSAKNGSDDDGHGATDVPIEQELREKIPRANELDELCKVECLLQWSPFHPPPPNRKLMGDIGYLMFSIQGSPTLHITAIPTGFYVNRSTSPSLDGAARPHFDPSPAPEPCFSHALLDCLLQASPALCKEWSRALEASKERAKLNQVLGSVTPDLTYFRYAVKGDFPGYKSPESAAASTLGVDTTFGTPSWLVPHPRHESYTSDGDGGSSAWNRNHFHGWDPIRVEEDLAQPSGMELRGGIRDWNEELQLARELPTETLQERLDKARLLHKMMSEFGEAVLLGVKAIADGQIQAVNPLETARSQVYLHNNIFFSRAIDAGPETFKLVRGDKAARKAANRDLQCNSIFHRMDKPGFFTLATVLVDYMGTRYVCQSVLPGILIGDHGHKILLGSVDSGVPLKWDKELHEALEEKIGKSMILATRPVLRNPLTQERHDEIERLKKELPPLPEQPRQVVTEEEADPKSVMMTCLPLEAKGIRGSDNRKYVLDLGRITPRDANWVPQPKGGTGKWEAAKKENGKSSNTIPSNLEDEEFYTFVLRPELVTRFTQYRMSKYVRQAKEKLKESPDVEEEKIFTTAEGKEFLASLRLNANVLLPDVKTFDGVDEEVAELYRQDEQLVREAATSLWDEVLPKITRVAKDGQISPMPLEGRTLVEFLHRHGVNCRYLGRLAVLAQHEEEKDAKIDDDLKHGRPTYMDGRHKMPKCWLELLETEIVARAAKHVLDSYMTENGAAAAAQPAQLIASFLSALVSESEETAAQTETRLAKRVANDPDEDDVAALIISGTGGDGDALPPPIRSRHEVWQDIELEVGRRFRYTLTLYNTGHNKTGRARHIPLLRRVCQRTGIRLLAKNYDVGGRCLCTSGSSHGSKLTASYPISPLDVYDIVPLMKHVAAYNEGFYPCCVWPSPTIPPLQVSLPDTRVAIDAAHAYTSQRALNKGLELASEALNLYQRVTDNQSHPCVIDCMELMATIFHEAEDYGVAALHAEKALSLSIQSGGFDTTNVVNGHFTMYQILVKLRESDRAVKHLRAALYLIELMSGPMHTEAHSSYHKLGNIYQDGDYNGKYLSSAVKCFLEAGKRDGYDRLLEGITSMQVSRALAGMGDYKGAIAAGKNGVKVIATFVGRDHKWTQESEEEVLQYTKLSVQRSTRALQSDKLAEETARANAVAAELLNSSSLASSSSSPPAASDDNNNKAKGGAKSKNSKKKKGKK
jgi:protein TIF31